MRLSVATTTRDRREFVLRALGSIAPQLEPGDELIVVDNGSVDGTAAAVQGWIGAHCPGARLIVEPNGGTSQARNTAVSAASSPIVCFIDDDATVDPGWLAAMRAAWERAEPRTAGIGGPIRPDWGGRSRPPWLTEHLLWIVTALDLGSERRRLEGAVRIWGANMSLRVEALEQVGGFDVMLGPRPGVPFGRDEEEELQIRLRARGFEIWWEPEAGVRHHLPPARLEPAYFHSFMRSQARRHAIDGGVTAGPAAYRWARTALRYLLAELRHDVAQRTEARISLSYWASALRACLRGA
jgi:glucosyl-dolichyl phosphate glucuronosyltransferase